jgi:thaumarchaeosortase
MRDVGEDAAGCSARCLLNFKGTGHTPRMWWNGNSFLGAEIPCWCTPHNKSIVLANAGRGRRRLTRIKKALRLSTGSDPLVRYVATPVSFVLPMIVLYLTDPASFQTVFVGRGSYIMFLWLFCLQLILSHGKPGHRVGVLSRRRTILVLAIMTVPTLFAIGIASSSQLGEAITALGQTLGVPYKTFEKWFIDVAWPISFEYLFLTLCFTLIILLVYSRHGVAEFAIPLFFSWATAFFFMLNTFAPYGAVWILQAFVPPTAAATSSVLGLLGYGTSVSTMVDYRGQGTAMVVTDGRSFFPIAIYWPSAGVHSLLIYSVTILLFITNAGYAGWQKIVSFSVGAAGTFAANVLRIVTICVIGLKIGRDAALLMHDYYGEVFFISWMIMYVSLITFGPGLFRSARLAWRARSARWHLHGDIRLSLGKRRHLGPPQIGGHRERRSCEIPVSSRAA